MKRSIAVAWLALIANFAGAAPVDDYAVQWPLVLSDDRAGAYGVMLDAAVYRAARSPVLRDVDVINAAGATVPAQLFRLDDGVAESRRVPVRWFVLPRHAALVRGDLTMVVERSPDGRVLRVEARDANAGEVAGPDAWLVDASGIEARIEALHLDWQAGDGDLDRAYRVEASEDLRSWRLVQSVAQLVALSRDGERLVQRRVPVGAQARYLRLTPADGQGMARLVDVQAELAPVAKRPPLQWHSLSGTPLDDRGVRAHLFTLDGRYPVDTVDIEYPGNDTGQWTLYSRDDAEAPWTLRAGPWVAYAIGGGDGANRSAPQPLARPTRDRQWKLVGATPAAQTPGLRLGWRPETLVFIAQGTPPYRLVAGSTRTGRADAPVSRSLEEIRRAQGAGWRPGVATPGTMQPLAGDRALGPAPPDWRTWLLWALLVVGALLVAGFAASLLRKPRA
ncbi:DUF3999 domain-containing protein [Luteimonas saliphila]|uniref:DUF3999 domain-containing protein n=1 Tax=Luteimonas saliphila TaxID=2804919 RepID=UPI00192D774D|nr:DUF3999 domain-containing protein [Luteimonas saliphila]